MPFGLVIGAAAAVKGVSGYLSARSQAQQNSANRAEFNSLSKRADKLLTAGSVNQTANKFGRFFQPFLNSQLNQISLGNQSTANNIQSNLASAGFGSTGIGASLSAGASRGAFFQNSQLQANILQRQLEVALSTNQARSVGLQQRANSVIGAPISPSPFAAAFQGAAEGAAGSLAAADMAKQFKTGTDNTSSNPQSIPVNPASFTGPILGF